MGAAEKQTRRVATAKVDLEGGNPSTPEPDLSQPETLGTGLETRSDLTRRRILDAARHLFATHGFDRTTIRRVAAAAQIDPALVIRYYGSKVGLFTAAADLNLHFSDLSACPRSELGKALATHFLRIWDGGRSGQEFALLLRTAVTEPEALKKLQAVFEEQLLPVMRHLAKPERARDTAALIASQVLGLALTRYVLRLPAAAGLSHETIVERVGTALQAYIDLGAQEETENP